MKSQFRLFGRLRPCPVYQCRQQLRRDHFCCAKCWNALPAELQARILEERRQCQLLGVLHTQPLLALRDEALAELNRAAREKEKPKNPGTGWWAEI